MFVALGDFCLSVGQNEWVTFVSDFCRSVLCSRMPPSLTVGIFLPDLTPMEQAPRAEARSSSPRKSLETLDVDELGSIDHCIAALANTPPTPVDSGK